MSAQLKHQLRAWAAHIYASEAGVELLIRAGLIYERAPWIAREDGRPYIDTVQLIGCVGVLSGGEQRVARIAASLLGGTPVDLSEDLPGLDRNLARLVLAAVAHANGSHEDSEVMFGAPESLYPWPTEADQAN